MAAIEARHLEVFQQPSVHALRVRNGAVPSSSWKVRDRKREVLDDIGYPLKVKKCSLEMMVTKRNLLFRGLIFRFHVKLQGWYIGTGFGSSLEGFFGISIFQLEMGEPFWDGKSWF